MPRPKTLPDNSTQRSIVIADPIWRALNLIAAYRDTSAPQIVRVAILELIQCECDASPFLAAAIETMCAEVAVRQKVAA